MMTPSGGEEPPGENREQASKGQSGSRPSTSVAGVGHLQDGGVTYVSSGRREQGSDNTGGQGDVRANG